MSSAERSWLKIKRIQNVLDNTSHNMTLLIIVHRSLHWLVGISHFDSEHRLGDATLLQHLLHYLYCRGWWFHSSCHSLYFYSVNIQKIISRAVMIDITQPKPRNIGFTIAHIIRPTIVARIIPITFATFFNAVWAGEGVKLEFLICLSFIVIKRYFFNAYNRSLKFVRSMNSPRDGSRGMFGTRQKKYKLTAGKSGDFFWRMAKNIPFRHVHRHERTHFELRL